MSDVIDFVLPYPFIIFFLKYYVYVEWGTNCAWEGLNEFLVVEGIAFKLESLSFWLLWLLNIEVFIVSREWACRVVCQTYSMNIFKIILL